MADESDPELLRRVNALLEAARIDADFATQFPHDTDQAAST